MTLKEQIARDLLSIKAVFFRPDEPFTWASGIKSPVYCDNRLTLTAPEVRNHVENGLVSVVREYYPQAEVLMGTSTAGIAHAAEEGASGNAGGGKEGIVGADDGILGDNGVVDLDAVFNDASGTYMTERPYFDRILYN